MRLRDSKIWEKAGKTDRYLLVNFPLLWASKVAHLLYGHAILLFIFITLVMMVPVSYTRVPSINSFITYGTILSVLCFCVWVYFQSLTDYRLLHGRIKRFYDYQTIALFTMVVIFSITLAVVPAYTLSRRVVNEFVDDSLPPETRNSRLVSMPLTVLGADSIIFATFRGSNEKITYLESLSAYMQYESVRRSGMFMTSDSHHPSLPYMLLGGTYGTIPSLMEHETDPGRSYIEFEEELDYYGEPLLVEDGQIKFEKVVKKVRVYYNNSKEHEYYSNQYNTMVSFIYPEMEGDIGLGEELLYCRFKHRNYTVYCPMRYVQSTLLTLKEIEDTGLSLTVSTNPPDYALENNGRTYGEYSSGSSGGVVQSYRDYIPWNRLSEAYDVYEAHEMIADFTGGVLLFLGLIGHTLLIIIFFVRYFKYRLLLIGAAIALVVVGFFLLLGIFDVDGIDPFDHPIVFGIVCLAVFVPGFVLMNTTRIKTDTRVVFALLTSLLVSVLLWFAILTAADLHNGDKLMQYAGLIAAFFFLVLTPLNLRGLYRLYSAPSR